MFRVMYLIASCRYHFAESYKECFNRNYNDAVREVSTWEGELHNYTGSPTAFIAHLYFPL